jgi:putative redox protein
MLDQFDSEIELEGPLDEDQKKRLLQIAGRCPVHRTLRSEIIINTKLSE